MVIKERKNSIGFEKNGINIVIVFRVLIQLDHQNETDIKLKNI